jgi:hypothetical protein
MGVERKKYRKKTVLSSYIGQFQAELLCRVLSP